jgi:hypothetical protein
VDEVRDGMKIRVHRGSVPARFSLEETGHVLRCHRMARLRNTPSLTGPISAGQMGFGCPAPLHPGFIRRSATRHPPITARSC